MVSKRRAGKGEESSGSEAETEPRGECAWHRRVRIDRTTDLLATAQCPPGQIVEETSVCLPPEYQAWAEGKGLSSAGGRPCWHGDAPRMAGGDGKVRIVYPNPWDVFVFDPNIPPEYQTISLRAIAPPGAGTVQWFVDGRPVDGADGAAPRWPLRPGEHTILVRDGDGGTSDSVQVRVE